MREKKKNGIIGVIGAINNEDERPAKNLACISRMLYGGRREGGIFEPFVTPTGGSLTMP